jgi:phage shock protein PspC (stress-responsive transcriptional regulator)
LADIELRIAELLRENSAHEQQIITMADIKRVIETMGRPEQFDEEADTTTNTRSQSYRNQEQQRKKLFRDPDDRYLGGVCSGLANYFGVQTVWIRLIFLVAFFGFGTGLLLYILLWILIPKAETAAEKLRMKGEPVNVGNIGKIIDEEFSKVKDQVHQAKEHVSDFAKKNNNFNSGEFFDRLMALLDRTFKFLGDLLTRIFNLLATLLKTVFRVLGGIIGLLFVLFGLLLVLLLFSTLFNSTTLLSATIEGFHYYAPRELFSYLSSDPNHWIFVIVGGLLLIGIPLLSVIYTGIKLLFPDRINMKYKGVGPALLILWILGLVTTAILCFELAMEFKDKSRIQERITLNTPSESVLYVTLNDSVFDDELDENFDHKYRFELIHNNNRIQLLRFHHLLFQPDQSNYFAGIPRLTLKKSTSDQFEVRLVKTAQGVTHEAAEERARSIDYSWKTTGDTLVLDPLFHIREANQLFRAQHLDVYLYVPENAAVRLMHNTNRLNPSVHFDYEDLSTDFWLQLPSRLGGHDWIRANDRFLCLSCPDMPNVELDSTQQKIASELD